MTPTISGRFKRSGQVSRLRSSRQANARTEIDYTDPVEAVTKSRNLATLAAFSCSSRCVSCGRRTGASASAPEDRGRQAGPQVGQQVPDFNLRDQTGRMRNLQSVMGPRGAMLVFFRSADW